MFAAVKSWVRTYVIPTNAVPLPLPRSQLASDVQQSLGKADSSQEQLTDAIGNEATARQGQVNQLNLEIQATNQTLQVTDQNLSRLNQDVVAIAQDLQTVDGAVFDPAGKVSTHIGNTEIHVTQQDKNKWDAGGVTPSELISGDAGNTLGLGGDSKLFVPGLQGGISEAPVDGKHYNRKNAGWSETPGIWTGTETGFESAEIPEGTLVFIHEG